MVSAASVHQGTKVRGWAGLVPQITTTTSRPLAPRLEVLGPLAAIMGWAVGAVLLFEQRQIILVLGVQGH